ncbi:MAG: ATP phosphoribosyltransferase [Pseudomonadota bacterium]
MRSNKQRVRIALQKSGRLTDYSLSLLDRCGIRFAKSKDQLFCYGENMPLDLLLVRDDDIPSYVADGTCDLGIVGQNVTEEYRLANPDIATAQAITHVRSLGFGHCRLVIAAPDDDMPETLEQLGGKRIATSYPALLADFLATNGVDATPVYVSGSVEISPKLGKADLVCDLVSTGKTLAANQLAEFRTILESEATIIQAEPASNGCADTIQRVLQRLDGVLQVRESKYVMLHAPRDALPKITQMLPGAESPTIVPLDGCDERVAVHAVCRETVFWETLEQLKSAGASSLLVLPVEKMLP